MSPIMLTSILILLTITISNVKGKYECCPEENLLSLITKKCSTNNSVSLECTIGYRIPILNATEFEEFNFMFMDNGTLIDQTNNREIEYCHSYPDDDTTHLSDHIYLICQESESEYGFEGNKIKVGAILGYISVAFTILTIMVYVMVPKLLDLQGICMVHALIGLAAGYTFLGVIQLSTYLDGTACCTLAFLTYFFIMYLFFWLNTLSFHIWRTTVKPGFSTWTSQWAIIYHIFAIGGTVMLLILVLIAHYSPSEVWNNIRPGIGEISCWFRSMGKTMIFFYGPIAILLFFNILFYVWTVMALWGRMENTQNKILKYRLKLCVRLCIIMGITWVFEILTSLLKDPQMSLSGKIVLFLLDLFNILQGLLIFLVLVVFRKRVRRALASKNLCNIEFPNSWKYLEDEEMESVEEKVNSTVAEYKGNKVEVKT